MPGSLSNAVLPDSALTGGTMPTDSILEKLTVNRAEGHFEDRFTKVHVFEVFGGPNNFAALIYMCRLNLDLDGASNSYGYNNPNSSAQNNLKPLESWHTGRKGVSTATSQKVGLETRVAIPATVRRAGKTF